MPAPPPRELLVSAAYFRLLGYGDATIAKKVNRHRRTLRLWRDRDDWPEIEEEAKKAWKHRLVGYSHRALRRGLTRQDGGWLALQILERLDNEWLPPAQKIKLMGDPDAPLEVRTLEQRLATALTKSTAEQNGHTHVTQPAN